MQTVRLKLTAQEIDRPLERELTISAEEADLAPVGTELHIEIRVVPCSGEAVVTGRIRAAFQAECGVCLAPVGVKIEEEFTGAYPISPDVEIDLLPDVRDAFMAGIPIRLKCSPQCKGLCVKCGKNLNQGPCSCSSEEETPSLKVILNEALEDMGTGYLSRRDK